MNWKSKTKEIMKLNKKQKKISSFLQSSDEEELGDEKIGIPKPNWKAKKPIKDKPEFHNTILELEKEDFRRFGLRVNWT